MKKFARTTSVIDKNCLQNLPRFKISANNHRFGIGKSAQISKLLKESEKRGDRVIVFSPTPQAIGLTEVSPLSLIFIDDKEVE
ncbi:hypothetical protein CBG25_04575 [Arsenophonus sp. ENCA]|uniref:hypothetical protein n=1 Tax=Arsenophonus sp. ENCA TaxID=1987579 RepID=UPI000BC80B19|nr:hypothetical protein [Arsenophonus sp. ENCA]PAV07925.1 hypothetical protein CBG25_04575 [Arsenophonus sp. ENCA]